MLLRHLGPALLSLTLFACGSSTGGEGGGASESAVDGGALLATDDGGGPVADGGGIVANGPNPAWLVGRLEGHTFSGSNISGQRFVTLRADGTATAEHTYYAGGTSTSTDLTWTFENTTLHLGEETYAISIAANCHLVQLTGGAPTAWADVYTLNETTSVAMCPQSEPPLTEKEGLVIGNWIGEEYVVGFRTDRRAYFSDSLDGYTFRFSIDADGRTYHFTNPDGTEYEHGTFTMSGENGQFCTTQHRPGCASVSRQ